MAKKTKDYKPTVFVNGRNRTIESIEIEESKTNPAGIRRTVKSDALAKYGNIKPYGDDPNCFSQEDWFTPAPLFGVQSFNPAYETRDREKYAFMSEAQMEAYRKSYQDAING